MCAWGRRCSGRADRRPTGSAFAFLPSSSRTIHGRQSCTPPKAGVESATKQGLFYSAPDPRVRRGTEMAAIDLVAVIGRVWHLTSMDARREWLDSEREQKRCSTCFSRAMLLSPPLLGLVVLGPVGLLGLDLTSNTVRVLYSVYLTFAFLCAIFFVRKLFKIGSMARYATNFISTALGIFAPLMILATLLSIN